MTHYRPVAVKTREAGGVLTCKVELEPEWRRKMAMERERGLSNRAKRCRSYRAARLWGSVSSSAADQLRAGHLWVYTSDIESLSVPEGAERPAGAVAVADSRGMLLGTALYSPASQIALRMVSRTAIDEAAWLDLLESRLRAAIRRRRPLLDEQNNACRLCFSEADELPGLVVDKYGDLVDSATAGQGAGFGGSAGAVRARAPRRARTDGDFGAARCAGAGAGSAGRAESGSAVCREGVISSGSGEFLLNGLTFHYDANSGQKTGAFLDQRANYAAAAAWAKRLGCAGRALDVCCYQGGFTLHLAQVCAGVTGIDASRASLEVAERNLQANRGRLAAPVDWVEGDAFQILRDWSDAGEKFDAMVLDPPAFAKSQRAVEGALRGYKELNLRALKMVGPGGLLITCSCSHHVSWADLEASVASAAADARRRVRLLERRGAASDHPVVLNLPETEYLKCLVLEVE